jgi:hypothetical protein
LRKKAKSLLILPSLAKVSNEATEIEKPKGPKLKKTLSAAPTGKAIKKAAKIPKHKKRNLDIDSF